MRILYRPKPKVVGSPYRVIAMPYYPTPNPTPNRLAISADGLTWDYINTVGLEDFKAGYYIMAVGDLMYLMCAAGESWANTFKVSSDKGLTWNTVTIPGTVSNNSFIKDANIINGVYVIANDNNTIANSILYSNDGVTFTGIGNTLLNRCENLRVVNDVMVAVGKFGTIVRFLTSPNGIDWTHIGTLASNSFIDGFTHDGTQYVLALHANTVGHVRIYTSNDLITWVLKSDINQLRWGSDITFFNGVYVITGSAKIVGTDVSIYYSSDLITWTPAVINIGDVYSMVQLNDKLVIGGIDSDTYQTATSINGIDWTPGIILEGYNEIDDMAIYSTS
jgi:hypothetical protein